jgi:hypothetical protein
MTWCAFVRARRRPSRESGRTRFAPRRNAASDVGHPFATAGRRITPRRVGNPRIPADSTRDTPGQLYPHPHQRAQSVVSSFAKRGETSCCPPARLISLPHKRRKPGSERLWPSPTLLRRAGEAKPSGTVCGPRFVARRRGACVAGCPRRRAGHAGGPLRTDPNRVQEAFALGAGALRIGGIVPGEGRGARRHAAARTAAACPSRRRSYRGASQRPSVTPSRVRLGPGFSSRRLVSMCPRRVLRFLGWGYGVLGRSV